MLTHPLCTTAVSALLLACWSASASAQPVPADTYFSLAVTENSHNHAGARLLYLDFQTAPFVTDLLANNVIVSGQVPDDGVTLDGDAAEWDIHLLAAIRGVPQNNYPLSEFVDAVGTEITVGSAWDTNYVYFVVQWEDAGHDASQRPGKWVFGDQGGGETGWNPRRHTGATIGAPNEQAVNASGHRYAGAESEDRIFFMFPIVDTEGSFTINGQGCANYCHANLSSDFPYQNYTGDGVVAMATNRPGDLADIWHWKAGRTAPSGFGDDTHLIYALGSDNGREPDAGTSAYASNDLSGSNPTWMHFSGLGYTGDVLYEADAVPFSGVPAPGTEIPRYLARAPSGSRGDVASAHTFDAVTRRWTVEFRRLRNTGDPNDHAFDGFGAPRPFENRIESGDAASGQALYVNNCSACHDFEGAGLPNSHQWLIPRVQRASGSLIRRALNTVPAMIALVPPLEGQEVEDIAAYLQTQARFDAVQAYGEECAGVLARWNNRPVIGSNDFELTLAGALPNSTAFLRGGLDDDSWAGFSLPLDLTSFGAPDCLLLAPGDLLAAVPTTSFGGASLVLPISNSPGLIGLAVYVQWSVADALANPLGMTFSNGLEIVIE